MTMRLIGLALILLDRCRVLGFSLATSHRHGGSYALLSHRVGSQKDSNSPHCSSTRQLLTTSHRLLVATAAVLGPPLDDFSTEDSAATAVEKPDQGVCVNKGSSTKCQQEAKIEEKRGGGGGAEHAATTLAAATAVTVEATAKAGEKEFQVRKPMVAAILALLVLQNAGASLVTAAVRKTIPYDGASVALLQEVAKVCACHFICRSITWLLLC